MSDELNLFDLRETITPLRVKRGVVPIKRKWKDYHKTRRQIKIWRARWSNMLSYESNFYSLDCNGLPRVGGHLFPYFKRNQVDGKCLPKNDKAIAYATGYEGKSSRRSMREKQQWWQQVSDSDATA